MITTHQAFVRPEQELARLTLISSSNEAAIRRRSTISGMRPFGLGEINGMPVAGPLGPPGPPGPPDGAHSVGHDRVDSQIVVSAEESALDARASDIDSETTLVSEQPLSSFHQVASENEKRPPIPAQPVPGLTPSEVTESVSASHVQLQAGEKVEPPKRPPPAPPRPAEAERKRQLIEEVELGAQQDVTEVINNVLFQSECAIKPRGIAPDGEQLDQIKE